MQIVLDTSALVRFFTNDLPQRAQMVEDLLKKGEDLYIPDAVFPELEYVLLNGYKSSREQILTSYKYILAKKNIHTTSAIPSAVALFGNSQLDMADCIIVAYSYKGKLASFDKKLLKVEGVQSYWENIP